ncbi:MAG: hypothetical protein ACRDMX_06595 [Solirubrobacteraceae bacterium]
MRRSKVRLAIRTARLILRHRTLRRAAIAIAVPLVKRRVRARLRSGARVLRV